MTDPSSRYVGKLKIQVLSVANLADVCSFGIQDPFVTVNINGDRQRTRDAKDAGNHATFNESLSFNVDAGPNDLVLIKAKHAGTFTNTTIGVFSMKVANFVNYSGKQVKFQLVDEENFRERGVVTLIPEYSGTNAPSVEHSNGSSSPQPSASLAPPPTTATLSQQRRSVSPMPITMQPPAPGQPNPFMYSIPPPGQQQQQQQMYGSNGAAQQQAPYGSQHPVYQSQPPQPYGQPKPVTFIPPPYNPPNMYAPQGVQRPYAPPSSNSPYASMQYQTTPPMPGRGGAPVAMPVGSASSSSSTSSSSAFPSSPSSMPSGPVPHATPALGHPPPTARRFDDMAYLGLRGSVARIMEVRVFADYSRVHGLQLVYNVGGIRLDGPIAGCTGPTGAMYNVLIAEAHGEKIEAVSVKMLPDNNAPMVAGMASLTIRTNRGVIRHFGAAAEQQPGGNSSGVGGEQALAIPAGYRVLGFHGTFNNGITSLGAYCINLL